jgi:hypothetical protein
MRPFAEAYFSAAQVDASEYYVAPLSMGSSGSISSSAANVTNETRILSSQRTAYYETDGRLRYELFVELVSYNASSFFGVADAPSSRVRFIDYNRSTESTVVPYTATFRKPDCGHPNRTSASLLHFKQQRLPSAGSMVEQSVSTMVSVGFARGRVEAFMGVGESEWAEFAAALGGLLASGNAPASQGRRLDLAEYLDAVGEFCGDLADAYDVESSVVGKEAGEVPYLSQAASACRIGHDVQKLATAPIGQQAFEEAFKTAAGDTLSAGAGLVGAAAGAYFCAGNPVCVGIGSELGEKLGDAVGDYIADGAWDVARSHLEPPPGYSNNENLLQLLGLEPFSPPPPAPRQEFGGGSCSAVGGEAQNCYAWSPDTWTDCGSDGCHTGWWGTYCEKSCQQGTSRHCYDGGCDRDSGECGYSGCDLGWWGSCCEHSCRIDIHHCYDGGCNRDDGKCGSSDCNTGWWGDFCEHSCTSFGQHCYSGGCNRADGTCGYSGCSTGWWGEYCANSCQLDIHHCYDGGCDRDDGKCGSSDCRNGWWGDFCENSCQPEIHHCYDGGCDRDDGKCGSSDCLNGWWGEFCENSCSLYGGHCYGGNCDRADGSCTSCESGWRGRFCTEV